MAPPAARRPAMPRTVFSSLPVSSGFILHRNSHVLVVLADVGRAVAHWRARAVEGQRQSDDAQVHPGDVLEDADRLGLRLIHDLPEVVNGGAGNAGLLQ